jgi:hypothetical protein
VNLSEQRQTLPREAPGTILVPPSAFTSSWEAAPLEPVLLGLRLVSAIERRECIALAKQHIKDDDAESPDIEEALQLALVRFYCWFGVCDANQVSKECEYLPYREHVITRLTESGARFIFDAIQKLEVEISPRYVEAGGDEVVELVERLGSGEIDELDERERSAVLRHLRFALEILRAE